MAYSLEAPKLLLGFFLFQSAKDVVDHKKCLLEFNSFKHALLCVLLCVPFFLFIIFFWFLLDYLKSRI